MNYFELTNEELCPLAKKGDEKALDALFKNNRGFLINQILFTESEYKIRITDKENFLQLGCIGIWKAVEHYDSDKGAGFLTYAAYWIKHEMSEEAERIVSRVKEVFIPSEQYYICDAIEDEFRADPAQKHFRRKLFNLYSNPENIAIQNMMYDELEKSFYRLNKRNRILVDEYYGYTTARPMTHRNISRKYNLFVRNVKKGIHEGLRFLKHDMCRLYHKRRFFERILKEIRETCREISRLKREQQAHASSAQNEKSVDAVVSGKLKESA